MTEEQIKKVIYNPQKNYGWKPEDTFILNGIELHVLNDYLSNFVTSNLDVPSILKVAAAKKLIQDLIARNVEEGKIKEVEQKSEVQPIPEETL